PTPTPTPTPTPAPPPVFDAAAAYAVVEHLAGTVGPREATSAGFRQAAQYVADTMTALGYQVSTTPFQVPAGNSWGVDVEAGTSTNVIADVPGFDPTQPHVVVGAHLDTVPQAPGAEDNASGVGVMIELARLAAAQPPSVPVRFIAFGAEEPRGDGDSMHHFGSQFYVRGLTAAQAAATTGMVSLDRVGVAAADVPVCTGGRGTTALRDTLVAAAATAEVPVQTCENRSSDHWSFEKADLPSARLGSVPYDGYHSPGDVPAVVDPAQLDRVGTVVWAWLGTF
ncbi:M28 family metallopeptidase, partial [Jiangella ureilytica]